MKFTKCSATNVAVGVAFLLAGLAGSPANAQHLAQNFQPLIGLSASSVAAEGEWTLLEILEGHEGYGEYVIEDVRESPDGRWELVLATDETVEPPESVFLIVDTEADVIRKEIRSGEDERGRVGFQTYGWTSDGSTAVLIETPLRPPYPDRDMSTKESRKEFSRKMLERYTAEHSLRYQARLVLIDAESGTSETVALDPEGQVLSLSSCEDGRIHAAVRSRVVEDSGEPRFQHAIHEIAPSGEYVARWDLPDLDDPYTLGDFQLDAKSRTIWANLEAAPAPAGPVEEFFGAAVDKSKYVARAPYGEGAEEAEWEHVLEDAVLLDVAPSGGAILFESRQTPAVTYELCVMDVDSGAITQVVAVSHDAVPRHMVYRPQPKSLGRGGRAVRLIGDGGLPELHGDEADPDLYAQRVLWECTLPE